MGPALIQGASRGIGLQFCRALADRGTTVIACCRDPANAKELKDLKSEHPNLINIVQLNVAKEEQVREAAKHVQNTHGKALDLLVNCSAILSPSGRGETSLKDVSAKALEETFAVNTFGPLVMAKHFGPLLQAGEGSIGKQGSEGKAGHSSVLVNMSARVGSIGDNRLGGWYSYRMSKAALNMATRNLSVEFGRGRKKVVCVALHPGTVNTDLSRPYHKNVPKGNLFSREQSVSHLLGIIDNLAIGDSGKFYGWDGDEIPF